MARQLSQRALQQSKPSRPLTASTAAVGALAVGALALGAAALGAFAIGRLIIGTARIRSLEIDDLTVHRLHVMDDNRRHSSRKAKISAKPSNRKS
jgi:hypothetical protein